MIGFLPLLKFTAAVTSPQSISDVLKLAGADESVEYTSLPSFPNFAIANNDSAIMQVSDFTANEQVLKPGEIDFDLSYFLKEEFPANSTATVTVHMNDNTMYQGTFNICQYMEFAETFCPLPPSKNSQKFAKTLFIPDQVVPGRVSIVGKLETPDNRLITQFAAFFDIENDKQ